VKIALLKILDKIAGIPAIWLLPVPHYKASGQLNKILLIRPGGIGDAALLVPAIAALKRRFPATIIDILAEKRNSGVFDLCPETGRILHYDRPRELMAAIRGNYDVVIDTEQWHRLSDVVARLMGAAMLVGFATNERKKLFTHPVSYSHDDYEVDSFLKLIKSLTGDAAYDMTVSFLAVPETSTVTVKPLLQVLGNKKIVALFPGGSINERKWGKDRFHAIAKMLGAQGYGIVVVGGKDDVRAGEEITREIPDSLNLCGKLALPETAAVLKEASLLITGDSGIMHIGYGVGAKLVALFGPGRSKKWAPRGDRCAVINKQLACSPCTTFGYTPKCRKNAECMDLITVDEVFAAAMKLLGSS
jgi:lipopolysaccharide heptosyltransferase II